MKNLAISWRKRWTVLNDKVLSLIGLSRKAGKLVLGTDAVTEKISNGLVEVVLVSSDLSERSFGNIEKISHEKGIEVLKSNCSMDDISNILKKRVGIIGIADKGFARVFKNVLKPENREKSDQVYKVKNEEEIAYDEI